MEQVKHKIFPLVNSKWFPNYKNEVKQLARQYVLLDLDVSDKLFETVTLPLENEAYEQIYDPTRANILGNPG